MHIIKLLTFFKTGYLVTLFEEGKNVTEWQNTAQYQCEQCTSFSPFLWLLLELNMQVCFWLKWEVGESEMVTEGLRVLAELKCQVTG